MTTGERMSIRIGVLIGWWVMGIALAEEPPIEKQPPNVIVILVDDLRFDSLGCTGHPFLQTPGIDRMAAEGLRFNRAFVTTSLCSPSRASLFTGQYMHRHGVIDNNVPLPKQTVLLPQILRQGGYQTAMIGKWHMGGGSDAPVPGFDRWVSFKGQGFYTSPGGEWSLNVDGQGTPHRGYITDELTDYAIDWLDKLDKDRPFYLHLAHKAVHAPFEPAPRHRSLYANQVMNLPKLPSDWETRDGVPMWVKNQRNSWHGIEYPYHSKFDFADYYRTYCQTLQAVDDSVGRLLDWVRQSPQRDRTLVLFLSDNGFLWGEHGLIDKRCSYEESIRIPMLMWGPGWIRRPAVVDAMAANIDIAPTVLDLAGIPSPQPMDGVSLASLVRDPSASAPRKELFYEYFWEWNFPQTPTQFALRTDRYKFIEYHGIWDTDELFDLSADPEEQINLVQDPKHQGTLRDLRRRLHAIRQQTQGQHVPLGNKQGPGMNKRSKVGSPAAEFPSNILN
jgi:N-acetylglucosamine-6-sulfatase